SRKVKSLWVIDVLADPRPELETYKYTMPGEEECSQQELWLFNMTDTSRKQIDVKAFNDQSLSLHRENKTHKEHIKDYVPSTWLSKSSDKLYITRQSRDLYKLDFCEVNLETDEVKVLIKDRMNTYMERKTIYMIGDGKEFINWSERDGWGHLYLYDGNGNMKNQITSGPWHVASVLKVDKPNRVVYFIANGHEKNENPYYSHLYKVNLDGSGLKLLNKGNFESKVEMSDSYKYFINNYSRVNTTPKSEIRDNNGNLVMNLETADLNNLFAAGYKFPEIFKAKAADGITDIWGVMYKPFNFDSTKKYPLLEYVYPGPQTEAVNTKFSSRMDRTDRFAQLGFVVISLGNRGGNPNRSKWYHNYGYGDLRDYGLADKKYVAEQLAQRNKFIDIEKVGISGHSGGGFMSTAALCQYPDFYKVAVSSAGNHDNNIYNRWWSETHHGVQEKIDDDGNSKFLYEIETNPQLAKNLKGKLLLVHGYIDNNVHPGNTIRMANALIKAKKRFDIFIMPGQRHSFGKNREYFFWLKADYFCKHLIGDYSISTDIFEMRRETKMTPSKKRSN
ncbi:MAG: DPP IV N-terminal domain-containing protein, partial [Bacteroidota bacterium]|nr:DPP IV N-terminal domain-containing protein [Bacteroidota bacterium]